MKLIGMNVSENSALSVSRDNKKSESLLRISEGRIKFLEKQEINHENANYIFEGFIHLYLRYCTL